MIAVCARFIRIAALKHSYSRVSPEAPCTCLLWRVLPRPGLLLALFGLLWLPATSFAQTLAQAQAQSPSLQSALPQPRRNIVFSDYLGMNTPLLFYAPEVYQRQLAMLKKLGLRWVRVDLHWDYMEPQPGQWRHDLLDPLMQTLEQGGFRPVVYLVGTAPFAATRPEGTPFRDQYPPRDAQEYAARMAALARRYPFVTHWQVWNEPNILPFWRPREDPVAYARLLQASAAALRQRDLRDRQVVGAGMAYYSQMPQRGNALMLEALGQLGALHSTDVLAYHPYSDAPEGDPDPTDADNFILRAHGLNARLRAAHTGPIWATEWGWSTYQGEKDHQTPINEAQQANYLLRRLMLMMALDYDRIFWFSFMDIDKIVITRDRHYGLVRPDASPKPAWHALQRFLALTGDRLEPLMPVLPQSGRPTVYQHRWQRADGRRITLFYGKQAGTLVWPHSHPVQLHWPESGASHTLTPQGGRIAVPVQASLGVLVE